MSDKVTLKKALDREIAALRKMPPSERGHKCDRVQERLEQAVAAVAAVRSDAFRQMREQFGWTYEDLGREYRISRQRAQQIVNRPGGAA